MKHFGLSMDGLLCCDVLAGEQVPFCSSVKRLADTRSSTCGLWKDQITSSSQKLNWAARAWLRRVKQLSLASRQLLPENFYRRAFALWRCWSSVKLFISVQYTAPFYCMCRYTHTQPVGRYCSGSPYVYHGHQENEPSQFPLIRSDPSVSFVWIVEPSLPGLLGLRYTRYIRDCVHQVSRHKQVMDLP